MELCRARVGSSFFLHLEARFGRSKLQNYDGILMGGIFKPKMDFLWRLVILFVIALPIALSVGYKQFQIGGESSNTINATSSEITGMLPYYGMFGPPGLERLDGNTGISLYFNATLPFREATNVSPWDTKESTLPQFPHPYGFNTLLLNEHTSALLDAPQANRLKALQQTLRDGESVTITANVSATVTAHNTSAFPGHDEMLDMACGNISWKMSQEYMFTYYSVFLLANAIVGDQSHVWVGFVPNAKGDNLPENCTYIKPYMKRFDTTRQRCTGKWSITRGGIQLTSGSSCNGTLLPASKQLPLTMNTLVFADWYTPQLHETLAPFATSRNQSHWLYPSMSTAVAAMSWSRICSLNGVANYLNQTLNVQFGTRPDNSSISVEEAGLMYNVADEQVVSIRQTLRNGPLLWSILAIQPLLVIVMAICTALMHSTPIDTGFGIVSILSGISPQSLELVRGAALSGELKEKLRVSIFPVHRKGQPDAIEYRLHRVGESVPVGRLRRRVVYA
ncbi:Hypothetical predicted protein [Lecanosticta acicola]|uniref:Uncharacterized protein n=1 Tax=Lecanosticta acicola TaxID=111012 RepID=A0AAI8Z5Y2_9PEZI|nr:Hypothetical predicted protein [Lecanosticta acicola]